MANQLVETRTVRFVIPGEPASKANQRQLVSLGGVFVNPEWIEMCRANQHVAGAMQLGDLLAKKKKIGGLPRLIKSKKALAYARAVTRHAPRVNPLLVGELKMLVLTYYATQRPDLECEVLRDALQGIVYKNDRQLRSVAMEHAIDRDNPRSVVIISPRRTP